MKYIEPCGTVYRDGPCTQFVERQFFDSGDPATMQIVARHGAGEAVLDTIVDRHQSSYHIVREWVQRVHRYERG
jgi:hypothetical protein